MERGCKELLDIKRDKLMYGMYKDFALIEEERKSVTSRRHSWSFWFKWEAVAHTMPINTCNAGEPRRKGWTRRGRSFYERLARSTIPIRWAKVSCVLHVCVTPRN